MTLCMATNNRHKLEEVEHVLGSAFHLVTLEDIGCHEELAEDQLTLEGNSLQKAQYVFEKYGVHCFADDTGLEVTALQGAPGVFSARYAGPQRNSEDNMNLLLANLEGATTRKAQFRCVVTLIDGSGIHAFEGVLHGTILEHPKGDKGFGYDPVFQPDGYSGSLAEMSMDEKNKISHRGIAIRKLVEFLKQNRQRA